MAKSRTYAGDVTIPPGRTILIAAPLGGTLAAPKGAMAPRPGAAVKKEEVLLNLVPMLAPDALANYTNQLVDVRGQVGEAKKSLELAKINLDRVERLAKSRDTSPGALEDAKTQLPSPRRPSRGPRPGGTRWRRRSTPSGAAGSSSRCRFSPRREASCGTSRPCRGSRWPRVPRCSRSSASTRYGSEFRSSSAT